MALATLHWIPQHPSGTGLGNGASGECFSWLISPGLSFRLSGHTSTYSGISFALVCSLGIANPVSGCFSTAQTSLHSTAHGNIVLAPTVDVGHLELHSNWGPQWFTSSAEEFPPLLCFRVNPFIYLVL